MRADYTRCLSSPYIQAPFLPGDSDLGQLTKIFETLGSPSEMKWPVSEVHRGESPFMHAAHKQWAENDAEVVITVPLRLRQLWKWYTGLLDHPDKALGVRWMVWRTSLHMGVITDICCYCDYWCFLKWLTFIRLLTVLQYLQYLRVYIRILQCFNIVIFALLI